MHTAYLSKELYKKDKDAGQTIRITNNSLFCQISFYIYGKHRIWAKAVHLTILQVINKNVWVFYMVADIYLTIFYYYLLLLLFYIFILSLLFFLHWLSLN